MSAWSTELPVPIVCIAARASAAFTCGMKSSNLATSCAICASTLAACACACASASASASAIRCSAARA